LAEYIFIPLHVIFQVVQLRQEWSRRQCCQLFLLWTWSYQI